MMNDDGGGGSGSGGGWKNHRLDDDVSENIRIIHSIKFDYLI